MTTAPHPPPAQTPLNPSSRPEAPAWHTAGTVIAPASRRSICWTVNIAVVALAAGAGWMLGWAWGLLFGVATLAWGTAGLMRTGQSIGHQAAGLRTVAKATGMPGSLGAVLARTCVTTDLRAGRDPLRLVPRPLPGITAVPPPPPPLPARIGVWTVMADDGSHLTIAGPTLVGRKADDPSGRYTTITIPDVSKTLSRNHAILEPTPDGLRVTDIGSGNGSAVVAPDRLHRIGKYQTATIAPGTRLLLGTRFFEVTYE